VTLLAGLAIVALGLHYVVRLGAFARGFRRSAALSPPAPEASGQTPTVSVIVAARNEEAVIGRCVDAILANDLPAGRYEVIVADDDSADRTAAVVRERARTASGALLPVGAAAPEAHPDGGGLGAGRLRLVHVEHDPTRLRAHNKRAIETAVEHARGEIVLTTDADCVVPTAWVRTMASAFADERVVFASGPVRYRVAPGSGSGAGAGLFARLQALDFLGLMACGAGGIGIGRPNLANGASVAYRRDVFTRLGGFSGIDDVTSGDDELLMQKIAYGGAPGEGLGAESVVFVNRPEATVVTEAVESLAQFLDQRKRWASKGTRYPAQLQAMLVGLVAFFLALLGTALALPFAPGLWPWLLAGLGLKAVGDLAVLLPATRRFRQRPLLWAYPLYGPLHVLHTLVVGLVGPLSRGFEWKGRRLDR
jgi:cellulose synthase/poly-beta-1,6-N-acetylglucosamine synthase-like glycosyltransferase